MATIMLYRHGDVMVKTFKGFKIPNNVELKKETVLHRGDNHDHFFSNGFALVGALEDKKYLRVVEPTILNHIEHGEISVHHRIVFHSASFVKGASDFKLLVWLCFRLSKGATINRARVGRYQDG